MRVAILADIEPVKKWLDAAKAKVSQAVGQKQGEPVLQPLVQAPGLCFSATCCVCMCLAMYTIP